MQTEDQTAPVIDVERARTDAEGGSRVAAVALMAHHGDTGDWPAEFVATAVGLYEKKP